MYVFWTWKNEGRRASGFSPPQFCSSCFLWSEFLFQSCRSLGRPFPIIRLHSHFSASGFCSVPGSRCWRFSSKGSQHAPCPRRIFYNNNAGNIQTDKPDSVWQWCIRNEKCVLRESACKDILRRVVEKARFCPGSLSIEWKWNVQACIGWEIMLKSLPKSLIHSGQLISVFRIWMKEERADSNRREKTRKERDKNKHPSWCHR